MDEKVDSSLRNVMTIVEQAVKVMPVYRIMTMIVTEQTMEVIHGKAAHTLFALGYVKIQVFENTGECYLIIGSTIDYVLRDLLVRMPLIIDRWEQAVQLSTAVYRWKAGTLMDSVVPSDPVSLSTLSSKESFQEYYPYTCGANQSTFIDLYIPKCNRKVEIFGVRDFVDKLLQLRFNQNDLLSQETSQLDRSVPCQIEIANAKGFLNRQICIGEMSISTSILLYVSLDVAMELYIFKESVDKNVEKDEIPGVCKWGLWECPIYICDSEVHFSGEIMKLWRNFSGREMIEIVLDRKMVQTLSDKYSTILSMDTKLSSLITYFKDIPNEKEENGNQMDLLITTEAYPWKRESGFGRESGLGDECLIQDLLFTSVYPSKSETGIQDVAQDGEWNTYVVLWGNVFFNGMVDTHTIPNLPIGPTTLSRSSDQLRTGDELSSGFVIEHWKMCNISVRYGSSIEGDFIQEANYKLSNKKREESNINQRIMDLGSIERKSNTLTQKRDVINTMEQLDDIEWLRNVYETDTSQQPVTNVDTSPYKYQSEATVWLYCVSGWNPSNSEKSSEKSSEVNTWICDLYGLNSWNNCCSPNVSGVRDTNVKWYSKYSKDLDTVVLENEEKYKNEDRLDMNTNDLSNVPSYFSEEKVDFAPSSLLAGTSNKYVVSSEWSNLWSVCGQISTQNVTQRSSIHSTDMDYDGNCGEELWNGGLVMQQYEHDTRSVLADTSVIWNLSTRSMDVPTTKDMVVGNVLNNGNDTIWGLQKVIDTEHGEVEQMMWGIDECAGTVITDSNYEVDPENIEPNMESEVSPRRDISGMTHVHTVAKQDSEGNLIWYFADEKKKILTLDVANMLVSKIERKVLRKETKRRSKDFKVNQARKTTINRRGIYALSLDSEQTDLSDQKKHTSITAPQNDFILATGGAYADMAHRVEETYFSESQESDKPSNHDYNLTENHGVLGEESGLDTYEDDCEQSVCSGSNEETHNPVVPSANYTDVVNLSNINLGSISMLTNMTNLVFEDGTRLTHDGTEMHDGTEIDLNGNKISQSTAVETPLIDNKMRSVHDESGSPITVSQFEMFEDEPERLNPKNSGTSNNLAKGLAFNDETVQHLLLDEYVWRKLENKMENPDSEANDDTKYLERFDGQQQDAEMRESELSNQWPKCFTLSMDNRGVKGFEETNIPVSKLDPEKLSGFQVYFQASQLNEQRSPEQWILRACGVQYDLEEGMFYTNTNPKEKDGFCAVGQWTSEGSMVAWHEALKIGFNLKYANLPQLLAIMTSTQITQLVETLSESGNDSDWRHIYFSTHLKTLLSTQIKVALKTLDRGETLRCMLKTLSFEQMEKFLNTGEHVIVTDSLDIPEYDVHRETLDLITMLYAESVESYDTLLLSATAVQLVYAWVQSELPWNPISTPSNRFFSQRTLKDHIRTVSTQSTETSQMPKGYIWKLLNSEFFRNVREITGQNNEKYLAYGHNITSQNKEFVNLATSSKRVIARFTGMDIQSVALLALQEPSHKIQTSTKPLVILQTSEQSSRTTPLDVLFSHLLVMLPYEIKRKIRCSRVDKNSLKMNFDEFVIMENRSDLMVKEIISEMENRKMSDKLAEKAWYRKRHQPKRILLRILYDEFSKLSDSQFNELYINLQRRVFYEILQNTLRPEGKIVLASQYLETDTALNQRARRFKPDIALKNRYKSEERMEKSGKNHNNASRPQSKNNKDVDKDDQTKVLQNDHLTRELKVDQRIRVQEVEKERSISDVVPSNRRVSEDSMERVSESKASKEGLGESKISKYVSLDKDPILDEDNRDIRSNRKTKVMNEKNELSQMCERNPQVDEGLGSINPQHIPENQQHDKIWGNDSNIGSQKMIQYRIGQKSDDVIKGESSTYTQSSNYGLGQPGVGCSVVIGTHRTVPQLVGNNYKK